MFSGSPYVGADGGFHGVFGRGTPDLDEHPESAKSRAAWLSVEDHDDDEHEGSNSMREHVCEFLGHFLHSR